MAADSKRSFTVERRVALIVIVVPFIGFIYTLYYFWGNGLNLVDMLLLFAFAVIHEFGVTAGYHRYFTHNSFKASKGLTYFLGITGSMTVQGPLLLWVAAHRKHHQFSDHHGDPHSPHLNGSGVWGALKGLWHSHTGWMLNFDLDDWVFYVPDLIRNKQTYWIHKTYLWWVSLGLVLPALLGGVISQSWQGALSGFLWVGLTRIFLGHHFTWSVNSICHFFGSQPFHTKDESRNNFLVALLSFGEGWHNNHHAFPTSARHGLFWWQIDIAYWFIVCMSYLGFASDVKLPKQQAIESKRILLDETDEPVKTLT